MYQSQALSKLKHISVCSVSLIEFSCQDKAWTHDFQSILCHDFTASVKAPIRRKKGLKSKELTRLDTVDVIVL